MALALTIRNRQQARALDVRLLRRITCALLGELLQVPDADLGIVVVAAPEMTRLNETFLRHAGSTDVITFDYADETTPSCPPRSAAVPVALHGENRPIPSARFEPLNPGSAGTLPARVTAGCLHAPAGCRRSQVRGEIVVCVDEAIIQARRFRTSWPAELVRYLVHGVLHLRGFDDHTAADRRRMKSEENRLLRLLAGRFPLSQLARTR